MRDRVDQILKVVCAVLGLFLAIHLGKLAIHPNPLARVTIPDLPSLPAETNTVATVPNPPSKPETNKVSKAKDLKTNSTLASADTNAVSQPKQSIPDTNHSPSTPVSVASTPATTNTPPTNSVALISTNTSATTNKLEANTDLVAAGDPAHTNAPSASPKKHARNGSDLPPSMMAGMRGGKSPKLKPEIQARVDRVVESEIFGPVMHPMPMALLGIAGNQAFLRSPSGQTGLVKEGEDLGEIKLLRIGVNRVLVEQNGEKKELMIFAGLGSDSLLPKPTESSDETTTNRK